MQLIIHNKVNTITHLFSTLWPNTVLLKQVYVVTAREKVADSWGSNFGEYAAV